MERKDDFERRPEGEQCASKFERIREEEERGEGTERRGETGDVWR